MKHVGETLKNYIETRGLKKREIADRVGITPNHLSTIFMKESIDCELYDRLCMATGMPHMAVFEDNGMPSSLMDIDARTFIGPATVNMSDAGAMRELLAEKERTIRILMQQLSYLTDTKS